jgi:hypothetical protein
MPTNEDRENSASVALVSEIAHQLIGTYVPNKGT